MWINVVASHLLLLGSPLCRQLTPWACPVKSSPKGYQNMASWQVVFLFIYLSILYHLHPLNFKYYGISESLPWAVRSAPLHSARLVPSHFLQRDWAVILLLVLSEIVCRISSSSQGPYTSVHLFPCYKKNLDRQLPYKNYIYSIHDKRSCERMGLYKLNEETITLTDKMQLSIFYKPPVIFFHEISVILKNQTKTKPARQLKASK